jgi:S1-C subfamily serine protease
MPLWTLLLLLPGQAGTVDSAQFPRELQERALRATVRFDHGGTGTLIHRDGPFVYVLTVNHAVKTVKQANVQLFSTDLYRRIDKQYRGVEVIARNEGSDLALLRIVTRDALPALLPLCPPEKAPAAGGFAALTVGCSDGKPPTCELREVAAKKLVQRPRAPKQVWCWETTEEQAQGRSGGPLLDTQGRVIGVCGGRNDGKGYYYHADEIFAFLDREGFARFFKDAPP